MNAIVGNGRWRLQKAIETEVRRKYAQELAAAPNFWKRAMVQQKIREEIKRQINQLAPSDALYLSQRFRF